MPSGLQLHIYILNTNHGLIYPSSLEILSPGILRYAMAGITLTRAFKGFPAFGTPTGNFSSRTTTSVFLLGVIVFALACLGGCDAQESSLPNDPPVDSSIAINSAPSTALSSEFPRIVAFGNSLTAGLGVSPDQSYPAQLQEQLNKAGYQYEVINAGVSGDTTAGGLRRLNWILKSRPSIVIVELGANDGLRGQPLPSMYANLDQILTQLHDADTRVVLAGMKIPPNYGLEYTTEFAAMYEKLARKHGVPLIPFLLEGVAAKPGLNQADGIHPTAAGYTIVAHNVMATLRPLLR